MKISFNKYGAPCANGASLNIDTLRDICDCLDIPHKLISAPVEMRQDDFKLAADYETKANKKEIFKLMLNHKEAFAPIIPEMETRISDAGNAYEVITSWSV